MWFYDAGRRSAGIQSAFSCWRKLSKIKYQLFVRTYAQEVSTIRDFVGAGCGLVGSCARASGFKCGACEHAGFVQSLFLFT